MLSHEMKFVIKLYVLLAALINLSNADGDESVSDQDVLAYLEKFGYARVGTARTKTNRVNTVEVDAIKSFQHMFHIPETGIIDNATRKAIMIPRCGVKDSLVVNRRKRRYAADGIPWSHTSLTYTITSFSSDMSRADQEAEFARAFKVWSDVTPLTFTYLPDSRGRDVDIEMFFATYNHGDYDPFDGPGGILAHAYFPSMGGDAHFDDSEFFAKSKTTLSAVSLFQVAAHELGHSLGLGHSTVRSALMAPYYRSFQADFQLDQDDINGIQYLYGPNPQDVPQPPVNPPDVPQPPVNPPNVPQPPVYPPNVPQTPVYPPNVPLPPVFPPDVPLPPANPPDVDYCQDGQFDAFAYIENGNLFGFRGDYVYGIGKYGIEPGYPQLIGDVFPDLPSDLDAALFWPGVGRWWRYQPGKTFFFKGSQVWVYVNYAFQYKASISAEFPGLPNNIDSAFVWTGNGKTYFTKGYEYYRCDTNGYTIDPDYPKSLDRWFEKSNPSIASAISRIDSATQWNDRTFFFVGTDYYKFNDQKLKIVETYPRSIAQYWYGCHGNNLILEDAVIAEEDYVNAGNFLASAKLSILISCVLVVFLHVQ